MCLHEMDAQNTCTRRLARLQAHLKSIHGQRFCQTVAAATSSRTVPHPQEMTAARGASTTTGMTELAPSVAAYMEQLVASGTMAGGAIGVARHGKLVASAGFGTYLPVQDTVDGARVREDGVVTTGAGPRPVQPSTVFLVASLTKVMTATAVMMLIEEGKLELDQLLSSVLSDCSRAHMRSITIRHLLTHTSGLPDEFPDNTALRRAGAPLSEFVAKVCAMPPESLLYRPGTDIAYQSTGLCLLGAVVESLSGLSLPRFLATRVFEPLDMKDTTLGEAAARQQGAYGARREAATVLTEQTEFMALNGVVAGAASEDTAWNWNSDYWRTLGAPWGGLLTSVVDVNRFCQVFVNGGVDRPSGARLLSEHTVELMTTPHTHIGNWREGSPRPPAVLRPRVTGLAVGERASSRWPDAWGLGWRINQAQKQFGADNPEGLFGHHGATGAIMWCDAKSGLSCAVLTTRPGLCYSNEFNAISDLVLQSFV